MTFVTSGEGCHQGWLVVPSGTQRGNLGWGTVINRVWRFREAGSVKMDKVGGYRPKNIAGAAPGMADATVLDGGCHLARARGRSPTAA
jgi:hypothetical protein